MTIDRRQLLASAGAIGVAAMVAGRASSQASRAKVIDVHTHMYSQGWVKAVNDAADPNFRIGENNALIYRGGSIGRMTPPMLDWDLRIKDMDDAKVDVGLISLTAPNVYWGTRAQSVAAARSINDDFAAAQRKYDGRIRWFASLPFQYEDDALAELRRAKDNGAIGVCTHEHPGHSAHGPAVSANLPRIRGHAVARVRASDYALHGRHGPRGLWPRQHDRFTSDTSLFVARMILDGVLDELPNLRLIACHGGGAFPYLAARFDIMWQRTVSARKNEAPPSTYLNRFWYDSIVYDQATLDFLIERVGPDRVLYGSDYPFTIGDMKGILARVDTLPSERRDAIRSGNAERLFDLT
jgi:aminocarboxymuconate-semialdehyde decarboxylase